MHNFSVSILSGLVSPACIAPVMTTSSVGCSASSSVSSHGRHAPLGHSRASRLCRLQRRQGCLQLLSDSPVQASQHGLAPATITTTSINCSPSFTVSRRSRLSSTRAVQAAQKAGLPEALSPQVEAWQQQAWQAFSSAQEEERRQLAVDQASSAVQVTLVRFSIWMSV